MQNFEDLKKELLSSGIFFDGIRLEDIPAIDLYMDQVTTLIDEQTTPSKRHPEDKPLTKSMIQNYTKNRLLPPGGRLAHDPGGVSGDPRSREGPPGSEQAGAFVRPRDRRRGIFGRPGEKPGFFANPFPHRYPKQRYHRPQAPP